MLMNKPEEICVFVYVCFLFQPARIFNTWLGDPSKLLLIGEVVKVIQEDNLLNNVKVTGDYLLNGLKDMQVILPKLKLYCCFERHLYRISSDMRVFFLPKQFQKSRSVL